MRAFAFGLCLHLGFAAMHDVGGCAPSDEACAVGKEAMKIAEGDGLLQQARKLAPAKDVKVTVDVKGGKARVPHDPDAELELPHTVIPVSPKVMEKVRDVLAYAKSLQKRASQVPKAHIDDAKLSQALAQLEELYGGCEDDKDGTMETTAVDKANVILADLTALSKTVEEASITNVKSEVKEVTDEAEDEDEDEVQAGSEGRAPVDPDAELNVPHRPSPVSPKVMEKVKDVLAFAKSLQKRSQAPKAHIDDAKLGQELAQLEELYVACQDDTDGTMETTAVNKANVILADLTASSKTIEEASIEGEKDDE